MNLYPLRWDFYEKTAKNSHYYGLCKILIDGVMVVKLGKIVYVFTQHEISTPFIYQNIHVEMLFFLQKNDRKFTLFWSVNYTSIELST